MVSHANRDETGVEGGPSPVGRWYGDRPARWFPGKRDETPRVRARVAGAVAPVSPNLPEPVMPVEFSEPVEPVRPMEAVEVPVVHAVEVEQAPAADSGTWYGSLARWYGRHARWYGQGHPGIG